MSRPPIDQPERLLASDATDFERRMLEAALQKKPSAKASARMATALGVTAATVGTATAATTLAAGAAASNTTAAAGATAVWPWVSIGVLGLVVAGAVVGTRAGRHSQEPRAVSPAVTAPVLPAPTPNAATEAPAVVTESPPHAAASQRNRVATGTPDLGDQVAFIDSARAAISTGAGRRALEILRRYQDKYPAGSFRPEASALKVEALMKLGREAEARALAQRFIAENRGSLLARRVADVAGLSTP
jgi:hypothetical protein